MKIALEIDDERFETEHHSLWYALEAILKHAGRLNQGDSIEVLEAQQAYILDKAGCL
jgi:hypothetical protein